jgi:hypothetical protein
MEQLLTSEGEYFFFNKKVIDIIDVSFEEMECHGMVMFDGLTDIYDYYAIFPD